MPRNGTAMGSTFASGASPAMLNRGVGRATMSDAMAVPCPNGLTSWSVRPSPPAAPKSLPCNMRPASSGTRAFTPVSISAIVTP